MTRTRMVVAHVVTDVWESMRKSQLTGKRLKWNKTNACDIIVAWLVLRVTSLTCVDNM